MAHRRVLITGCLGFIGKHLLHRFQCRGWDVVGVSRKASNQPDIRVHDLSEPLPANLLAGCDLVIHAAARSNPWGTARQFDADNVKATENILDACQKADCPPLIFISSSSVYYRPEHQWAILEETPFPERFVNHYAATKAVAEQLVRQYSGRWAILRPRAVYGPGDTVLFPRILRAARAGRFPLLTCSDGPVMGDLIYIDNLIDAIEAAAVDHSIQGDFNLTNDCPVDLLQFLFEVLDRLQIPRPTRRISAASAMRVAAGLEMFHRVFLPRIEPAITRFGVHVFRYSKTFDITKAKRFLGAPKIDNDESIRRTVDWFRLYGKVDSP